MEKSKQTWKIKTCLFVYIIWKSGFLLWFCIHCFFRAFIVSSSQKGKMRKKKHLNIQITINDPYRAFSFTWPAAMPNKTAEISRYHQWFQREITSEERGQKFHTTHIWIVLLIGGSKSPTRHNQSEALTRSGKRHVISMDFLRLFLRLRGHFAGKPVVA